MRRKTIVATLVLAAGALLAGVAVHRLPAPAPAPVSAQPAPPAAVAAAAAVSSAPAASTPAPDASDQDDEGEVTRTLKGRDFSLHVTTDKNGTYPEVTMDDGTPIRLLRTLEGGTGELANFTFNYGDGFKLVDLIPGEPREQIVYQGSQLIPRGEGLITTYTLYRIVGDRLEELLDVITDRDREAFDNMTAQRLEATLEPTIRDGRPAFVYRVRTGGVPERTIVFVWNGKRFEDTSGEYDKIDADNRP